MIQQNLRTNDIALINDLRLISRADKRVIEASGKIGFRNLPLNQLNATSGHTGELIVDQQAKAWVFEAVASTSLGWIASRYVYFGLGLRAQEQYTRINTTGFEGFEHSLIGINTPRGNDAVINLGPSFHFERSKFRMEVSVPVVLQYQYFSSLPTDEGHYNKAHLRFAPHLNLRYAFRPGFDATATASYSESTSGIKTFLQNLIATNYRNFTALGSGHPSASHQCNVSSSWNFRNDLSALFISLSGYYSRFTTQTMVSTDITDESTSTSVVRLRNATTGTGAQISFGKGVFGLRGTLDITASCNFSRSTMLRNGILAPACGMNAAVNARLHFGLFGNRMVVDPTVSIAQSRQRFAGKGASPITSWTATAAIKIFPFRKLEIGISPDYTNNSLHPGRLSSLFLNANARYIPGKRWEFEVLLNNLTDRRVYNRTTVSDMIFTTQTVALRGLEIMLTAKYNF